MSRISVKDHGAVGDGVTNDHAAIIAALDASEAAGGGQPIYMPAGTYNVGDGLSMAGYSSTLVGDGSSFIAGVLRGTVLYAKTQSGPVLDLEGWVAPANLRGNIAWGNFALRGSGVADPTKANKGLRTRRSGLRFTNIFVMDTGGAGVDFVSTQLGTFQDIIVLSPVEAKANDVPYFMGTGPMNGNHFTGLGCRSIDDDGADTGVSGAHVYTDNNIYPPKLNKWDSCWFEYLQVPADGTLFHLIGGTQNTIADMQVWDSNCAPDAAGTETSVYRFDPPTGTVADYGANVLRGQIGGRSTTVTSFRTGVDMRQSKNTVEGVKGYKGYNVTIAPGVSQTSVRLSGGVSNAIDPAVDDQSGKSSNVVVDDYLGVETRGGVVRSPVVKLTAAEYSALARPDAGTLYVVVG